MDAIGVRSIRHRLLGPARRDRHRLPESHRALVWAMLVCGRSLARRRQSARWPMWRLAGWHFISTGRLRHLAGVLAEAPLFSGLPAQTLIVTVALLH
eukprot:scaffold17202_cov67-Phaeocystis_antarctica.AAC.2